MQKIRNGGIRPKTYTGEFSGVDRNLLQGTSTAGGRALVGLGAKAHEAGKNTKQYKYVVSGKNVPTMMVEHAPMFPL